MTLLDSNPRTAELRHRDPNAYNRPVSPLSSFVVTADPELLSSDWLTSVLQQTVELLELRRGWSGPQSRSVEPRLFATLIVDVLPAIMPPGKHAVSPQLVPTQEGGVQLKWHVGGWDVEVVLSPLSRPWVECDRADGSEGWSGALSDKAEDLKIVLKEIADR